MSDHGLPALVLCRDGEALDLGHSQPSGHQVWVGCPEKSRIWYRYDSWAGPAPAAGTYLRYGPKLQLVSRFKEEGCQTNTERAVSPHPDLLLACRHSATAVSQL